MEADPGADEKRIAGGQVAEVEAHRTRRRLRDPGLDTCTQPCLILPVRRTDYADRSKNAESNSQHQANIALTADS